MSLTARQERFVSEYVIDLNGTQAAIRAGYSAHTANEQAARLLAKVSVKEAVEAAKARVMAAVETQAAGSAAWIVAEAVRVVAESTKPAERVPALALLARRHPEFSEKHDLNVNLRAQMLALVASMPEDELRAAKEQLEPPR